MNTLSLLDLMVERGKFDRAEIQKLLPSKNDWGSLKKTLLESRVIDERELCQLMSEVLGIPFIPFDQFPKEPLFLSGLSAPFMRQGQFLPVELNGGELTVITHDPLDFYTLDAIRMATGLKARPLIGMGTEILEALQQLYGVGETTMEKIIEDIDNIPEYQADAEEDIDHLRDLASEAPVIRLVNLIITKAIDLKASDIHFEPYESQFRIRYRVDGVLHDAEAPPKRLQSAIISRVKIMAKMNIAERRLPQDGRIMVKVKGKEIDFRVSTVPTIHGESVVLRILDKTSIVLDIEKLGFPHDILADFDQCIKNPHGILLVTGPTGSGKTTTLYCALEKINSPDKKIVTVEDPVEYQLRGVNQIQVKPAIGLTFANALRSIVRQDPDVILIGEIRDAETAEIAIHSALTGHLVFSTLHTNDAASAITRLIDMGIEDYLLTSTLVGILAQRLVRVICPFCQEEFAYDDALLKQLGVPPEEASRIKMVKPRGCAECGFTGYRGRTGIFEFLKVTDEIRALILQRKDSQMLKELARQRGMRTLRQDGWLRVKEGITTVQELLRVTQEEVIL
ncbi:MAG: type II secretion system protein GspE [Deltaproteobacteria bacterium RBG_13_52_11b]|nr:MAG: type II secretion system protein GspE [Deltaproteobacteria bacterium RBG_13_52_11b]